MESEQSLNEANLKNYAQVLDEATQNAREIPRLTQGAPNLSVEEGYQIQSQGISLRLKRGEKIVGWKMGLTSKAKMHQMGVHSPIYGVLTDRMQIPESGTFLLQGMIHPKIEPEIACFMKEDLYGEISMDEALMACSGVCAAMEILDSRFKDFQFLLPDVVADNCSSCAFVLGRVIKDPFGIDLGNLGMIFEATRPNIPVPGKTHCLSQLLGASSAIYGHPGQSLVELSRLLGQRGLKIQKGSIVLTGAATQAISLQADSQVSVQVQDLGAVQIQIV